MNDKLWIAWLEEERCAQIHGWDFSHIEGRFSEELPPWSYAERIASVLTPDMRLLDIDTGGGEFLRSLHHPPQMTAATEGYPPNIALCGEELLPLGIDFRAADAGGELPFDDASFDIVINRHGSLNFREIYRVLKPGGVFLTQQVGADNDRELVQLLLPGTPIPFSRQRASCLAQDLRGEGFAVTEQQEAFCDIRFFDVGALVWFAHIIEWEFPGFSVESCRERLLAAQAQLEKTGSLCARTHRIFLQAQKKTD